MGIIDLLTDPDPSAEDRVRVERLRRGGLMTLAALFPHAGTITVFMAPDLFVMYEFTRALGIAAFIYLFIWFIGLICLVAPWTFARIGETFRERGIAWLLGAPIGLGLTVVLTAIAHANG